MPLKMLVISNYRPTHTARPEAEIMLGLAQKGMKITVMTYGDAEYVPIFKEAGIAVIDFYPRKKFDRAQRRFIRAELKRGDYDLMHLFTGRAMYNGIPAARGLRTKVVLYRGYEGHVHWYDPSAYLKFLHPRVDAILCNSEGVEEYLRRQMRLVRNRTVTINKGHRLEWYDSVEPLPMAELGLPEEGFYAVCAANNRKMKGIPYLLEAFRYIPNRLNLHLLLLGRDMDNEENLKIVAKAGKQNRVHFLGWRADSLRIVKGADTFVLPSLYGESITKSVLESMSMGTPAIITDIPGNREMIVDGESGYVVPKKHPKLMASALLKMARDRERCREMGEAARERIATRFSSARSIEQYFEFYRQLAAR